jgi:hypothetical protein
LSKYILAPFSLGLQAPTFGCTNSNFPPIWNRMP